MAYDYYNQDDLARWGRDDEMPAERQVVQHWLRKTGKDRGWEKVLELGCGKGNLQSVHPNYVGIDIAFTALQNYFPRKNCIQADIERLPIAPDIDFLFSFAAIEHVPHPERTLSEIDRVLAKGGVAIISPAWFCRPWAANGLPIKKYSELGAADKISKFFIPLRDSIIWMSSWVFPRRLLRELACFVSPNEYRFTYDRLNPNLDEYVYTDCDAFASMDPHAAILFFKSRGYKILNAPTLMERFFIRNVSVVIQK